jgi:UDP-glucose 4-epimerase
MKVLVTGGAGFIGSHVVDSLIEKGFQVVVVDDLSTGKERNINPLSKFYKLDLRSQALREVFEREKPDYVSHQAAQVDVIHSSTDPLYDAEVNILGSINLIECAKRYRVKKLIYASTGGALYGEPLYLPCDENHPIRPVSQYGVSKHTVEHYLYLYRENYGLDYTILRYPNVYGPRQDPYGEAGVVAIFARQMLEGEQVIINGNGEQERDFLYVDDCIKANLLAMEKGSGEVYNLGWGIGTSINRLFEMMREITGYDKEPIYGPRRVGEVFKIYLDASKARRELGWQPQVRLEEGLKKTIAYLAERGMEQ